MFETMLCKVLYGHGTIADAGHGCPDSSEDSRRGVFGVYGNAGRKESRIRHIGRGGGDGEGGDGDSQLRESVGRREAGESVATSVVGHWGDMSRTEERGKVATQLLTRRNRDPLLHLMLIDSPPAHSLGSITTNRYYRVQIKYILLTTLW